MRTIRTLGVALVALLAAGAVSASGAAAHAWKVNGVALTKATAVSWTSTVQFEFPEEVGQGTKAKCVLAQAGTVGPGASGEITSFKSVSGNEVIACEHSSESGYCVSQEELTADNLPWHTELVTVGTELRDIITSGGKGVPGIKLQCGSSVVVCTFESSTAMTNVSGGVDAAFDANSGSSCSGRSVMRMKGLGLIALAGKSLTVS